MILHRAVLFHKLVLGAKEFVPKGEEGLRKVCLDTPYLVVDIVVDGVIRESPLEQVEWKTVPAVVINGFHGGKRVQEYVLAWSQPENHGRSAGSESVQQKAFNRVVVQGTISVWHVEPVVARVESTVEPFVHVHGAMQGVLPGVDVAKGEHNAYQRKAVSVEPPQDCIGDKTGDLLAQRPQLVNFKPGGWNRVERVHGIGKDGLHYVLQENVLQHLVESDLVSGLLFGAGMDPVLFSKLVNVNDVEKGGVGPVCKNRGNHRKNAIGNSRNKLGSLQQHILRRRIRIGKDPREIMWGNEAHGHDVMFAQRSKDGGKRVRTGWASQ